MFLADLEQPSELFSRGTGLVGSPDDSLALGLGEVDVATGQDGVDAGVVEAVLELAVQRRSLLFGHTAADAVAVAAFEGGVEAGVEDGALCAQCFGGADAIHLVRLGEEDFRIDLVVGGGAARGVVVPGEVAEGARRLVLGAVHGMSPWPPGPVWAGATRGSVVKEATGDGGRERSLAAVAASSGYGRGRR